MFLKANTMDFIYFELCEFLLDGKRINNTLEQTNIQFTLTNINNNVVNNRNISLPYAFGELLWYFNGDNSVSFISKFGKMWERLSDDGETNNSAYGFVLMKKFGFNQIEKIIELLKIDPFSRRAVLNINTPNVKVIETKDEPCTIALQFLIRGGKLDCTAIMRSNDIWFGTPYDVIFFTELQKYIARRLDLEPGEYTHFATSLHVYDQHIEAIGQVKRYGNTRIKIDNKNLIEHGRDIFESVQYEDNPKLFIVEKFKEYGIYEEVNYED